MPVDERLALIDKLIVSLNLLTESSIDKLWAQEAERRIDELDNGKEEGLFEEKVFTEFFLSGGKNRT